MLHFCSVFYMLSNDLWHNVLFATFKFWHSRVLLTSDFYFTDFSFILLNVYAVWNPNFVPVQEQCCLFFAPVFFAPFLNCSLLLRLKGSSFMLHLCSFCDFYILKYLESLWWVLFRFSHFFLLNDCVIGLFLKWSLLLNCLVYNIVLRVLFYVTDFCSLVSWLVNYILNNYSLWLQHECILWFLFHSVHLFIISDHYSSWFFSQNLYFLIIKLVNKFHFFLVFIWVWLQAVLSVWWCWISLNTSINASWTRYQRSLLKLLKHCS